MGVLDGQVAIVTGGGRRQEPLDAVVAEITKPRGKAATASRQGAPRDAT